MSTYSGFSSRKLEDKYNHYLKQIVQLFSQIIISQIDSQKIFPFRTAYRKIQSQFRKLDSQKYSQTKISKILQPFTEYINQLDCVKQWRSQPRKYQKKQNYLLNNNFIRTRRPSLQDQRRTISFSTVNNSKSQYQKQLFSKQNRYNFQQQITEKLNEQISQTGKKKKVYRSRQASVHLVNGNNSKYIVQLSQQQIQNDRQLSMQQLMKRNPLIQRKMSAQRKRKVIKVDFPQIRQQDEQQGQQNQNRDIQKNKYKQTYGYMKFKPENNYSLQYE